MVSGNGKEVQQTALFTAEQLKGIGKSGNAFGDALALVKAAANGAELVTTAELGDGFSVADKATLVGVPMVCLYATLRSGELGDYAVFRNVTKDGRKVVIVDGSTGMKDQLVDYQNDNPGGWPQLWNHGLRVSRYDYTDEKTGELRPAETYYIDTSS